MFHKDCKRCKENGNIFLKITSENIGRKIILSKPNIVTTRIDERLIHGQGHQWIKALGINTVIVANDEASEDKMAQTLMKTGVPKGVRVRFFTVDKVIDIIHKAAAAQTIFIITKDTTDLLKLIKGGVPITEVNIGNIHSDEGKEMVTRSIFFGDQERSDIKEMIEDYGVSFNTKTTPRGDDGAKQVDVKKYI